MKWVKDRTGRFPCRPHYLPEELDADCEKCVADFLLQRHNKVQYPISTDDLTVFMETITDDLDLYADLSQEDGEVEGVTYFFPGHRPKVKISKELSLQPRMLNRFRTTLTHEFGHVKFHAFMFDGKPKGTLFEPSPVVADQKCKRDGILRAQRGDWMEWQAGYACGALLMPVTALRSVVLKFLEESEKPIGRFEANSTEAQMLINLVSSTFTVSREAARVRLLQHGKLTELALPAGLF